MYLLSPLPLIAGLTAVLQNRLDLAVALLAAALVLFAGG